MDSLVVSISRASLSPPLANVAHSSESDTSDSSWKSEDVSKRKEAHRKKLFFFKAILTKDQDMSHKSKMSVKDTAHQATEVLRPVRRLP